MSRQVTQRSIVLSQQDLRRLADYVLLLRKIQRRMHTTALQHSREKRKSNSSNRDIWLVIERAFFCAFSLLPNLQQSNCISQKAVKSCVRRQLIYPYLYAVEISYNTRAE